MGLSFLVILFSIEEKNSYLYIANCININRFNMKLESNKYNGRTISIFGEEITFKAGVAEVSDELGERILASNFPNIYAEGKTPVAKSKNEMLLEGELTAREQIAKEEINRLKSINLTAEKKIVALQQEITSWKEIVEKMKVYTDPSTLKDIMNGNVEDKPAENGEPTPEEIRKELSGKKKDELVAMAKELEFTDEQLMEDGKLKTKDAIIELLMSAR